MHTLEPAVSPHLTAYNNVQYIHHSPHKDEEIVQLLGAGSFLLCWYENKWQTAAGRDAMQLSREKKAGDWNKVIFRSFPQHPEGTILLAAYHLPAAFLLAKRDA